MAKQQLCTCVTLFCTFLCRRCTTTTWKRPNFTFRRGRQHKTTTYFSFPELWYSLLEFNSRKNCQHLTNWTSWNKRDKVWSSANSHFTWRFRSRRRCQPGYHMSGKSQTIGDFTFCRPSSIYRIIATILSLILPMNLAGSGKRAKNWNLHDRGTAAEQFRGLVVSEIHRPTSPTIPIWVFICREWSPTIKEIWDASGTLPILQICPRPSQTIGDIYDSWQNLGQSAKQ